MKNFTLNAWRQGPGQFALIGLDFDWLESHWYAVSVGLFGFCACLTYWPGGRA